MDHNVLPFGQVEILLPFVFVDVTDKYGWYSMLKKKKKLSMKISGLLVVNVCLVICLICVTLWPHHVIHYVINNPIPVSQFLLTRTAPSIWCLTVIYYFTLNFILNQHLCLISSSEFSYFIDPKPNEFFFLVIVHFSIDAYTQRERATERKKKERE